jgi:7-cyano-7-deazaguanine synthase
MGDVAIAIVSGGMDSVTMAYFLKSRNYDLKLLSFDYGQRHKKELGFAHLAAKELEAEHQIVDLSSLLPLLKGSALTDPAIEVPLGHYADVTMKSTVVPNRNAIMLSVAYAWAVSAEAEVVAIGVHAGDHPIYPDCRPEFVTSFERMEVLATSGYSYAGLWLYAPFIKSTKADIARLGEMLEVPWQNTWSCYLGGKVHCGKCGTCVERKEAFLLAGVADPTLYQ